jgi:hypothetical protein
VTAETADEAVAAEVAGVEMVVCRAANVARVREGSRRIFVTALGFAEAVTADEILRTAFSAITGDAYAVLTSGSGAGGRADPGRRPSWFRAAPWARPRPRRCNSGIDSAGSKTLACSQPNAS